MKAAISKQTGMPTYKMDPLTFGGVNLADDKTLASYIISDGSEITNSWEPDETEYYSR
jgi:hypothetical protein